MATPAPHSNREIQVFRDVADIASRAAELILAAANAAVQQNGRFTMSLAGGSTPKTLYSLLAAEPYFSVMPWDKTYIFFGDERCVPPDDKDSNFRMANESMLSKLSLKPEQVHRIKTENPDPEKAAHEYEQLLTSFFNLSTGKLPRFDVILIGMGDEGHMLSLFRYQSSPRQRPPRDVQLDRQALHLARHRHRPRRQQLRPRDFHGHK